MRCDHTAVGGDIERILSARRAPECARRGADGALVRARHGRAVSDRVEADHGLFRVDRDVERTGSADGEVFELLIG